MRQRDCSHEVYFLILETFINHIECEITSPHLRGEDINDIMSHNFIFMGYIYKQDFIDQQESTAMLQALWGLYSGTAVLTCSQWQH